MAIDNLQEKEEANENLGTSLVQSFLSSGVGDIAADAAEIALDSVLNEGLLEEVPVFGWIMKSHNVIGVVRDRIFLKKVANFLLGTQSISNDEREKFLGKLNGDSKFSKNVGESLVLLLERQDNLEKSLILGKLFSRYVRSHIEYKIFLKLAKAVEVAFIDDLRNLGKYYASIDGYDPKQGKPFSNWLNDDVSQSLYTSGLIRSEGVTENTYYPNDVGKELLRCLKE